MITSTITTDKPLQLIRIQIHLTGGWIAAYRQVDEEAFHHCREYVNEHVNEQMGPVSEQMGPVSEQMGPVNEQMGPVNEQMGPVNEQTGLVHERMGPVNEQMRPVNEQMGPVNEQMGPVNKLVFERVCEFMSERQCMTP